MLGGWLDARRSEIQSYVEGSLKELKLTDYVAEINIPFARSTFVRLNLKMNDDVPIQGARNLPNAKVTCTGT